MKKLILASMILLATGAAHAEVGNLATSGTVNALVSGQNSVQVALTNIATVPQQPIVVTYSASNNAVAEDHVAGTVAQYATVAVPATTNKVMLSAPSVTGGNSAHAAVSIINDASNTEHHTDKLYATAVGGDTLYVGLVAMDGAKWKGGETAGLTTVTFYAS